MHLLHLHTISRARRGQKKGDIRLKKKMKRLDFRIENKSFISNGKMQN